MNDDMIKVYEEELFDNGIGSIWLNDILDDEGIAYENRIVNREDSLYALNFMVHRILEVYVPKFYAEKVLDIINEYNSQNEEIQDIPELADYSDEE